MKFLALVFAASCSVATPQHDMALRALDDYRCISPEDVGRVMWWMGTDGPTRVQQTFDDRRYVCVDHGPARHGFWFETIPEER